mmetsp:Transcript_22959/g.54407  ORF Transcript_22959/g.54407 Transcript_22959/m.54407 type:complete len:258 (-) Transcript_22959:1421-2194(-)
MSSASSSLSLARLMASFETRRSESSARYLNPSTWLRLKGRGCTTAWPFSACFATRPASLAASSGATRERAVPLLPPRAVRPHRCVYARSVCGRSKLTTVSTFLKSSPRITPYSLSRVPSAAFDIFFKSLILAFAIPRAPAPERRSFWRWALSSSSAIPFPPFFPAFAFASFSSSSSSSSAASLPSASALAASSSSASSSSSDSTARSSASAIFFIMSSAFETSFFLITLSTRDCWSISRDTFRGRSSESTTPRMNER